LITHSSKETALVNVTRHICIGKCHGCFSILILCDLTSSVWAVCTSMSLYILVYISCAQLFHCDISMHAYNVFWRNSPLLFLFLYLPSSLFKQFLTSFIMLVSHMCIKYFDIFFLLYKLLVQTFPTHL
jgi:hypothetical protein